MDVQCRGGGVRLLPRGGIATCHAGECGRHHRLEGCRERALLASSQLDHSRGRELPCARSRPVPRHSCSGGEAGAQVGGTAYSGPSRSGRLREQAQAIHAHTPILTNNILNKYSPGGRREKSGPRETHRQAGTSAAEDCILNCHGCGGRRTTRGTASLWDGASDAVYANGFPSAARSLVPAAKQRDSPSQQPRRRVDLQRGLVVRPRPGDDL
mmetsp:Transcript_40319/g.92627  ORF Transcript_40319/g.92627 Transcript_40319/m.92627 type:complete len:212 (+) Transcript_40319:237-872(+)